MRYAVAVDMGDRAHHLCEQLAGVVDLESATRLSDRLLQVCFAHILHEYHDMAGAVASLEKTNYVRMVEALEEVNLAPNAPSLVKILDARLFEHFDRFALRRVRMHTEIYNTEATLADLALQLACAQHRADLWRCFEAVVDLRKSTEHLVRTLPKHVIFGFLHLALELFDLLLELLLALGNHMRLEVPQDATPVLRLRDAHPDTTLWVARLLQQHHIVGTAGKHLALHFQQQLVPA
mmetsp:Transcript_122758/g.354857  ORF Transcript_122758/g.354857 Transcript_122758/m.354857 type:complete len:236 (-) Transcript_122758:1010-1717(-)